MLGRAASALEAIKQDRSLTRQTNPIQRNAVAMSTDDTRGQGPVRLDRAPQLYANPMQLAEEPLNLRGMATALRGLYSGMSVTDANVSAMQQQASSIRDSASQIDNMVSRSRRDNPMAPPRDSSLDAMNASDEMFNRFQRFQQASPIPRDSFGAARNSRQAYDQTTAGFSNGYNGMLNNPMMSPKQKEQLAEQNARRIVGGGAAADPTNMRGRFGGTYGMGLDADAADIQNGRAARLADGSVVRFTGTQESVHSLQWLAGKAEREALRDRSNLNVPQSELDRRAAADAQQAERSARARAFEAANGGMNYRQYDRMQNSNALTMKAVDEGRLSPEAAMFRMQTRADKALRRAGNPMAMSVANGGRLFPDLTKGRGGNAPAAAPNPMIQAFEPGAPNTPENNAIRDEMKAKLDETSPTLQAMGVAPDMGPAELADAVTSYQGDISDEGLIELHNRVKTFAGDNQGKSPFEGSNGPTDVGMFAELWALPIGTPPSKIREWLQRYRAEAQRRSQFRDSGPMGTGQVPPTGGPPPSQPLYIPTNPIRTGA